MTVKELIEKLKEMDQDALVISMRDPEGNGFSPLYEAYDDGDLYVSEEEWSGYVVNHDERHEYDEEDCRDIVETSQKCVLLCPTN